MRKYCPQKVHLIILNIAYIVFCTSLDSIEFYSSNTCLSANYLEFRSYKNTIQKAKESSFFKIQNLIYVRKDKKRLQRKTFRGREGETKQSGTEKKNTADYNTQQYTTIQFIALLNSGSFLGSVLSFNLDHSFYNSPK